MMTQPTLRRALGRWDLTAIGVNQVIGGAIFLMPSQVAAQIAGAWAIIGFVAVGLLSLTTALCFAEVGSRFDSTGGPYLYTRAAFGRFAAFEVGWMQWFTRAASWSSVVSVLVASLGFYWPGATAPGMRAVLITVVISTIAGINVSGIRQSSVVVNLLTAGKLLPLAIFIVVGLPFIDWSRLTAPASMSVADLSSSALLLIFAFGGYEVIPVVA